MKKHQSPPREKKKPIDYRQFAKKHFKDHLKVLPLVSGASKMKGKTYTYEHISKKIYKKYNTKWICTCGTKEEREQTETKIFSDIRKISFVACPRCCCPMKFKGIEENIFTVFYLYIKCLFQTLKKNWVKN